jgi:hypothetical protein
MKKLRAVKMKRQSTRSNLCGLSSSIFLANLVIVDVCQIEAELIPGTVVSTTTHADEEAEILESQCCDDDCGIATNRK